MIYKQYFGLNKTTETDKNASENINAGKLTDKQRGALPFTDKPVLLGWIPGRISVCCDNNNRCFLASGDLAVVVHIFTFIDEQNVVFAECPEL